MAKVAKPKTGKKDITLRDVVVHMQHMEQRLSSDIKKNSDDIKSLKGAVEQNTVDIKGNSADIKSLKTAVQGNTEAIHILTERVDALDIDLVAVMKDTIKIRQFVHMPVPADE